MRVDFSLILPPTLYADLIATSRERNCSPKQVCREAVEVLLAGMRQRRLRPEECYARKGPRQVIGDATE